MALDADTLAALLDTVRRFVAERLVPIEAKVAEDDAVPPGIIDEMRALGLFGLSIPEEYGGLGLTLAEEIEVAFLLGGTSPAFRSVFGTNVGIGSQAILIAGTEAQKARFLPKLASGEIVGSFALTEPGAGSDAGSLATTAVRDGDAYVLNGTKRFITNAPVAGLFTVMARTGGPGTAGISCFLVEGGSPGLSTGRPDRKMGQQGTKTADVVFTDCRVPAENRIGAEGEGFKVAMKVLDRGRLHIAAVCTGIAARLIADMVRYARERVQFGKPISEFQLVQAMIAEARVGHLASEALVRSAAAKAERGERVTLEAAAAKLFASEMVGRVADAAVQIHGGAGYIADYGIERFYRDVRLFRLYEGTSEIQKLVIARETMRETA